MAERGRRTTGLTDVRRRPISSGGPLAILEAAILEAALVVEIEVDARHAS